MEGKESLPAVQRKFDFYEIEWHVEKFSLASRSDSWKCQSPEINVRGYHTTKWFITLQCESDVSKCITLTLKRSDSDAGPEIMCVDWRTAILSVNWNPDSSDRFCVLKKGSECIQEFKSDKSILELFRPFQPDCFIVQCKLILYSEDSSLGFQLCQNPGLRGLSENLLELFYAKKDPDLEVKINDNTILAHKVIVYSRIDKFNFLLRQEYTKLINGASTKRDSLDLSHLNYDGMMKIMEYAYSGDLKHVISLPSLAIYDCVREFGISELKSYYTPCELFLRTSVKSKDLVFKWLIPDISALMCNKAEISPVFSDDCFGTKWQLRMSSYEDECETDYFAIRAELLGEIKQLCASLEFAIIDKNGKYFFPKRVRCSIYGKQMFEFKKFVSKCVAKSLSDNNCLHVIVRIQLSRGLTDSYTEKQIIPIINCVSGERCYYLLSANMEFAFESGFFSDFRPNINGSMYKIHKCIVAARSEDIYDLMRQVELEDCKNKLSDVEPNVFRLLLKFLYTGLVTETDYEGAYGKLYEIAVYFYLPDLREFCKIYLNVLSENNLTIKTETLELSKQNNDEVMKESIEKCVSEL